MFKSKVGELSPDFFTGTTIGLALIRILSFSKMMRLTSKFSSSVWVLLLATLSLPVLSQTTIGTKDFFALTAPESVVTAQEASVADIKMPWVESYELRTETRDFDFDKQEYTLRLSPNTRRKYKAQTSLYRHQESAPDFDGQEIICDALVQRYNDWLELFLISSETALLDRLELVLKDRATVLNRLAGSLDFEWAEVIALREDQTDLSLRRAGLKRLEARLTTTYRIAGTLNFDDMASLEELRRRLQGTEFKYADPKTTYELEQIARELELERAEQRQFLDFAQVKYQGPHEDPARERLSIGVGLQLPLSGNQVLKVRELELEEAALRNESARDKENQSADYEARLKELVADLDHYDLTTATYAQEQQELARIADQLRKKEGFNPLPLLKIKERELRNQLRQLGLSARLYEDYLKQAERSGEMCNASAGELLLK